MKRPLIVLLSLLALAGCSDAGSQESVDVAELERNITQDTRLKSIVGSRGDLSVDTTCVRNEGSQTTFRCFVELSDDTGSYDYVVAASCDETSCVWNPE